MSHTHIPHRSVRRFPDILRGHQAEGAWSIQQVAAWDNFLDQANIVRDPHTVLTVFVHDNPYCDLPLGRYDMRDRASEVAR